MNPDRKFQPGDSVSVIFTDEGGKSQVRADGRVVLLHAEAQLNAAKATNLPDYLQAASEARISPSATARELRINKKTLIRVVDLLGIPRLTQAEYIRDKWQDPAYREAATKGKQEEMLQRWQNPEYREFMRGVNNDPANIENWRRTSGQQMRRRWEDSSWRERMQEVQQQRWTEDARTERGEQARALWTNPTFLAARNSDAFRQRLSKSIKAKYTSDPNFREQNAARLRSPENRERNREAIRKLWSNPEFRARMSQATREQLALQRQDPAFMELQKQATARSARGRWETPEYRSRMQEVLQALWANGDHRKLVSASSRSLWLDVERRIKMLGGMLRSVHGERRDLDFYALSTYEANIARVLMLIGRDFYTREVFTLQVEPEFAAFFQDNQTTMAVDFVTEDPRGRIRLYEIMAHPLEDPMGWAKLTMLMKQHSDLDIRSIEPREYAVLTTRFADRVNTSGQFCGWETTKDNLRTNPEKYK